MQSLLDHIRTEKTAIRLGELLADLRSMQHAHGFPRSPGELRDQLDALAKAGLVRSFERDQEEWIELVRERMPEPTQMLF